jgi:hypothetical protein
MLQIDHVYEFFFQTLFKEFDVYSLPKGCVIVDNPTQDDIQVFTPDVISNKKIFFYDQEPFLIKLADPYITVFEFPNGYSRSDLLELRKHNSIPYNLPIPTQDDMDYMDEHPDCLWKQLFLVTSEHSYETTNYASNKNLITMYYFFHGFAALDWYRGFYALNYNKQVNQEYRYDYVSFNRLVSNDRSYRCYFVSRLAEELLLEHGQISFGILTEQSSWQEEIANTNTKLSASAIDHIKLHLPSTPLIIDSKHILGSASADIPRCINDSFWHIVTETVFYYDKLHLTEKIFKPIVMKQPFMLLAAPGNLAYLKQYGFKTFEGIIDESYDLIQDSDDRVDAVVKQLVWYCTLSAKEKQRVIEAIAPIVEYNFHHFYGEFKHIISKELLDNCKNLFKEIGYDDSNIAYEDIYKTLIN